MGDRKRESRGYGRRPAAKRSRSKGQKKHFCVEFYHGLIGTHFSNLTLQTTTFSNQGYASIVQLSLALSRFFLETLLNFGKLGLSFLASLSDYTCDCRTNNHHWEREKACSPAKPPAHFAPFES